MQLPDPRIGMLPADPAKHSAISVAGDTAHLAWLQRLVYLTASLDEIGPGIGCLLTKPGNERLGGLLDGCCIIRLKIGDLHGAFPSRVRQIARALWSPMVLHIRCRFRWRADAKPDGFEAMLLIELTSGMVFLMRMQLKSLR